MYLLFSIFCYLGQKLTNRQCVEGIIDYIRHTHMYINCEIKNKTTC